MPKYMILYCKLGIYNPAPFFTDDLAVVQRIARECAENLDYCEVYVREDYNEKTDMQAHYVFEQSA